MARFRRPRLRRRAGAGDSSPEEEGSSARASGDAEEPAKPKAKEARRRRAKTGSGKATKKSGGGEGRKGSGKAAEKGSGKAAEKGSGKAAERGAGKATKKTAGKDGRKGSGKDVEKGSGKGGKKSSGEGAKKPPAGDKAVPKEDGRLARLRERAVPSRLRRDRSSEPGRARRVGSELWFRFKTRLRVIANWLREKLQPAGRLSRRAGAGLVGLWTDRSRGTKLRIVGVAAVLAAWALIRFTAVPGVPCEISDAKECPPVDEVAALVPADALLYAHLTLDEDTEQYERVSDLAERLPNLAALVDQLAASLPAAPGEPGGGVGEVLSWADRDLGFALLPDGEGGREPLILAGVGDRAAAESFLSDVAAGEAEKAEHEGAALTTYGDDFAAAFAGDELAFGDEDAVRAALDAAAGREDSLTGGAAGVREELPELRFADVYLSGPGVRRLLRGRRGGATQLETFVNYGASAGMAASATAREDGVEVELISAQDPKRLKRSPTFFSSLPEFDPDLAGAAGPRALVFLTVGELGPSLSALLKRPGTLAGDLAASLRRLDRQLRSKSQVSVLGDLVPALGGQAALIVEPTDTVPVATLVVDGVDSERASRALVSLQKPLLRSFGTDAAAGVVPRFEEREIEGVSASSVRLSPQIELTYALFEDRLVISTSPAGVKGVRAAEGGLTQADSYVEVAEQLPETASALLFLNLDELLGLAEAAGLAEDPLYASLRDDIATVRSIGLAVNAAEDELRTDLFLAIDDE